MRPLPRRLPFALALPLALFGCSDPAAPSAPLDAAAQDLDTPAATPDEPAVVDTSTPDVPPALDVPAPRDIPTPPRDVPSPPPDVPVPPRDIPTSTDVPPTPDVPATPDVPPPPPDVPIATAPNADCAMATPLSGTTHLAAEDLRRALGSPASASCGAGNRLFYAVTVPPASSILVTVTPTGAPAWDPYVRVLDACRDSLPLCSRVASYAGAGAPEHLRYVNSYSSGMTGLPVAHDVIIDVAAQGAPGTFDLDVRVDPPDPNATCDGALPLPTDGSTLHADLGHGGSTGYVCLGGLTGVPTLYYEATVPPGSELIATMTPTGEPPYSPELFSYTTCPGTCRARVHSGSDGAPEAIVVPNDSATAQTLRIGASATASTPLGTFDLTGRVVPQFYAMSSITASCETVPSVGHYTAVNRVTTVSALPFPFTLYGDAVAGYGLSTNGFLQLFTGTTGTLSATPINRAIPLPETPNGLVAPFWDALAPRPTFGSDLRAGALGTAPDRRFVVEWSDWGLVEDPTARLRFQAKLFESTRVIELHYCSLAMGTMTDLQTARHATVGVENLAGTRAVLIGANNRRVITSGGGFRLTPR